jgi:hypothetical protein
VENILGPAPAYPENWPQYITEGRADRLAELYISGRGYWQDTGSTCQVDPKALELSLLVGVQTPRRFELVEDSRFENWPGISRLWLLLTWKCA